MSQLWVKQQRFSRKNEKTRQQNRKPWGIETSQANEADTGHPPTPYLLQDRPYAPRGGACHKLGTELETRPDSTLSLPIPSMGARDW